MPHDDDVGWLWRLVGGKSHEEALEHFSHGDFGERMHELLYSLRPVFRYYSQTAAMYLTSSHEDETDSDADAASAFLNFLLAREERDPGSVAGIYRLLRPCIDFIASNQVELKAPVEIYGEFAVLAKRIEVACRA